MSLISTLAALNAGFWRVALPEPCALCGKNAARPLCERCITVFDAHREESARPVRCLRCAAAMPKTASICRSPICDHCQSWQPAFDAALALADYRPPVDALIIGLKFHARLPLAREFGWQLAEALAQRTLPSDALIVPIPLARERLVTRGFNQAWEIARVAAGRARLPADARCLQRVRHTASQSRLAREARQHNLCAVFTASDAVRGRAVVLVDDVMTTGATCHEAAAALKAAGARYVLAAAILRTPHG